MMRKYVLVWILLIAVMPIPAKGQATSPLPVETVIGAKMFATYYARPDISPDGRMLAYVVQDPRRASVITPSDSYYRTGVSAGMAGYDIYVAATQGGQAKNLTGGAGTNWAPVWSPDGKFLAFLSNRDGEQAKLWLWEASTGSLKKVSDSPVRASEIQWLPDSHRMLVTVLPEGMTPEQYVERAEDPQRQTSDDTRGGQATARLYKSSGQPQGVAPSATGSNFSWSIHDLVLIDVANDMTRRLDPGDRIQWYVLSPDGATVLIVSGGRFEGANSQAMLFDVKTISLATGQERVLLRDTGIGRSGTAISWSPNSSHIAYSIDGGSDNGNYFVLSRDHEMLPQKVTQFPELFSGPRDVSPPLWDTQGESLYFFHGQSVWRAPADHFGPKELATVGNRQIVELIPQYDRRLWSPDGGKSAVIIVRENGAQKNGFCKVDLSSGEVTKILEQEDRFLQQHEPVVSRDGRQIVYFMAGADHPPDIWLAGSEFHSPRQLTHLNPELEKYQMGRSRLIEWRSADGELLHGALLLPAGYKAGKRHPLIALVYGGHQGSNTLNDFGGDWILNIQLFATRGYAVLLPDAPQHLGTPMADIAKTILPGVEKVVEIGIADSSRIGVMGQSYGGYTTLALLIQTKRFRAAAMVDGFGDLIGMYGEMGKDGVGYGVAELEQRQGLMGGSPWQYRERYIENSPIFYLDRVETPLLIVHGSADGVVASFLGDEVFVGLRRLGKEVEYAKYEKEDHSPRTWSHANYSDFCNRMIAWFDKYLKPGQPPN